jgi:hypothetical protein
MLDILPIIVILGLFGAAYLYYRHYNSQKTDNTDISTNGQVGVSPADPTNISIEDTSGDNGTSGDNR